MKILGLSAYYHDSAAALIEDGIIVAAAQEERFTRKKHDDSFPTNAIQYCLQESGLKLEEIDFFVFYEKPLLKFERLIETYIAFAPRGFISFQKAIPIWVKSKIFQKREIIRELMAFGVKRNEITRKIKFSNHHLSHAASAFFPSKFDEALILTMDGVGEWATTSVSFGHNNKIDPIKEINFPHSLGLLYSAFTYYCGFKVNSGEYKLMGLAPYGQPIYAEKIKQNLIKINSDGSYFLNMDFFDFATGLTMTNQRFNQLFDGPPRKAESNLTQKEMDLASSIQLVLEEVILKICRNISDHYKVKKLCLAGGVALNCVANGAIKRSGLFDEIWIQPAAGDAGGAIGSALAMYYIALGNERNQPKNHDQMKGAYLGPQYDNHEIERTLIDEGAEYFYLEENEIISFTAMKLSEGFAVGHFNGRMEFGPRALGNRSILADPRSETMQSLLNLKVKFRESFRPFAPSVLLSECENWFEEVEQSPYMLLVGKVITDKRIPISKADSHLFGIEKLKVKRSLIPAVTHVDYSARLQTVDPLTNSRYFAVLSEFNKLTGVPILVNTSFNVRGEPIVCTPSDAYRCFMGTDIDLLVIGNFVLYKQNQNSENINSYKNLYSLD
jgi:carbamoyltransferase